MIQYRKTRCKSNVSSTNVYLQVLKHQSISQCIYGNQNQYSINPIFHDSAVPRTSGLAEPILLKCKQIIDYVVKMLNIIKIDRVRLLVYIL